LSTLRVAERELVKNGAAQNKQLAVANDRQLLYVVGFFRSYSFG
jgi:hypothetical protein